MLRFLKISSLSVFVLTERISLMNNSSQLSLVSDCTSGSMALTLFLFFPFKVVDNLVKHILAK